MPTAKGTPTAESKPVTSGPVNPPDTSQKLVTPEELLVTDTDPQVKDGQVFVSDAVSQAAVDAGYEPDNQPKSHDATSIGVPAEEDDA